MFYIFGLKSTVNSYCGLIRNEYAYKNITAILSNSLLIVKQRPPP